MCMTLNLQLHQLIADDENVDIEMLELFQVNLFLVQEFKPGFYMKTSKATSDCSLVLLWL